MRRLSFIITAFFFMCISLQAHAADKAKVYALSPERISEYIDRTEGQKRVLFIYTSWCVYCREKMPAIFDLEHSKKGSIIAVSVDENYNQYAQYAKTLTDAPFPLMYSKGRESALKTQLAKRNIKPWRGYPTFIFLDEHGNAVSQGSYRVEDIANYVLSE